MKIARGNEITAVEIQKGLTRKILGYGDELMTCEFDFEEGVVLTAHSHFNAQTSYVISGSLEFHINDEVIILNAGDNIFLPPHLPHGVKSLSKAKVVDTFSPKRDDFLK